MRKKRLPIKRKLPVILLVVVLVLGLYWQSLFRPADSSGEYSQSFVVAKGEGISSIANRLQDEGLIRSPLALRISLYRQGLAKKIQAGNFYLSPRQSVDEIARALTRARQLEVTVTIPEGYRNEQIAQLFYKEMGVDPSEFYQKTKTLEGKLFPDTYNFNPGDTVDQIIAKLTDNYQSKTSTLKSAFSISSLSENEVLTLASIIERETLAPQEKPVVSGILHNRLNNDWPLQTDATLQYILGSQSCKVTNIDCTKNDWWPVPSGADKKLVSPYNTYLSPGLPPAPIANPGLDSIKAALEPASTSYWFYLHDSSGSIRYAETAEEHSANISKYLR